MVVRNGLNGPRSSVAEPGARSTTTSRWARQNISKLAVLWRSDGNLGNVLPICRLRNSAQSFRTPLGDVTSLLSAVSACGLSLTGEELGCAVCERLVFLGVGLDLIAPLFVFANPIPLGDIPCSMTLTFR